MVGTFVRFFFCLSLVLVTASKRKLEAGDEPAFKLARTDTRTGPLPPTASANNMLTIQAPPPLISDIVTIVLKISEYSLAYPFSLVSREFFKIVCSACFAKLQSLPISPSDPTSKTILTFASQHLKMSGLKVDPEVAIDAILRLVNGTDNQLVVMRAITFLSQLEFPELKKKDAMYAVESLRSNFKQGDLSNILRIDYLRIKYDGFSAFSNVVYVEIFHRIRCSQDAKFCLPDHVNRSKNIFFGNIRVFYPECFRKMHEEIIIMDNLPIMAEGTVKFLPFYQEIMGGLFMDTPSLTLDSVLERIKAEDCNLFWKICTTKLAALPIWQAVTPSNFVYQDPILMKHFDKFAEVLRAFSAPAGFSIKGLSDAKKKYVFTCLFAHLNLGSNATDDKVKLIASKALNAHDFETSVLLHSLLKLAGRCNAIYDAIDAAIPVFNPNFCALDIVKKLDGRLLADYVSDRRKNLQSALLLRRIAGNLDQIINGDVTLADRYNAILESVASQDILTARQMAYMIIYTTRAVASLRTDENLSIIVNALSKKGNWVQEALETHYLRNNITQNITQ